MLYKLVPWNGAHYIIITEVSSILRPNMPIWALERHRRIHTQIGMKDTHEVSSYIFSLILESQKN